MTTMEAWLAQLEMEADQVVQSSMNNPYNECETMETTFIEQLSATLGQDFPYPYSSESNSNSNSPDQWDLDNIIIDQFSPPPQISKNNDNNNNNNNNKNKNNNINEDEDDKNVVEERQNNKDEKVVNGTRGGAKRKRQPNQVQDHILAERRRRELLSQMFISLSALVPGLKKMDKTSVLGEAIKHMKQLQEKVKALEEIVAKKTVESVLVVKKSQLVVNDYDNNFDDNVSSSTVDDNSASASSGGNGGEGGGRELENAIDSLPEIEVRISGSTLLLKVYCQNKKGVLTKLFEELEKHDLSVNNTSVVPFNSLALDITIVAQMQRGFNLNAKNFVRNLRSALRY